MLYNPRLFWILVIISTFKKEKKSMLSAARSHCCCCCCCKVASVVSNSVQPHRLQPTRLSHRDSPGKNTGVGCDFLLQCMKVKSESEVAQSCPTLCDPMDWRRKWQPTPVFLPGESQGRGSLVGCRLWGLTELDTTEATLQQQQQQQ